MRIGIITCNNAINYGARLQVYALYAYLRSQGHDAFVIDYMPPYVHAPQPLWYYPGMNVKEWMKLIIRYRRREIEIEKYKSLENFSHCHTHLSDVKYQSLKQLQSVPPEADVYIAGSDQIWNTDFPNGKDPAFYLDFGREKTKRISYAASFAIPAIPQNLKDGVAKHLAKLNGISVREASGQQILADLGYDSTLVCDPAFLLRADEWNEIAKMPTTNGDRYLLVYDFEYSEALKEMAKKIANLRGLKIYSVSPREFRYADRNYSACGPEEFLGLIQNADCVVSNSLHGTIFSMIFQRDFYVVNRIDGLNIRMSDLLSRYGLQSQIVDSDTPADVLEASIPYPIPHLDNDIELSKKWLNETLDSFSIRKEHADTHL